jgi:hypothetical protein
MKSLSAAALAIAVCVVFNTPAFSQTGQQPAKGKKYVATEDIIFDKAAGRLRKPTAE